MVGRRDLGEDRCCFFLRPEGRRETGNARNVLVMGKKSSRDPSPRSVYTEGGGTGSEIFVQLELFVLGLFSQGMSLGSNSLSSVNMPEHRARREKLSLLLRAPKQGTKHSSQRTDYARVGNLSEVMSCLHLFTLIKWVS